MTQTGEGTCTKNGANSPDKSLIAKVLAVKFNYTYKACRNKKTIHLPHWPAGSADGYQQSKKAAVLPLGKDKICTAIIKVKVERTGPKTQGWLIGTLGGLRFRGEMSLSIGIHHVEVTLIEPPDALSWIKGEMSWQIKAEAEPDALAGTTAVELFFIFDDPSKIAFFSREGVWIEALRFIFDKGGLEGTKKAEDGVSKVTQCCFDLPHHRYDIEQGIAHFGGANGEFQLTDYMKRVESEVNHTDQSCAVIAFSAALGLEVKGLCLRPFGFLKLTHLVGHGPCNNPFPHLKYRSKNPLIRTIYSLVKKVKKEGFLVVGAQDEHRSYLASHMFCEFNGKIFDATFGPALGQHKRLGYMRQYIDIHPDIPTLIATYKESTGITLTKAKQHFFPKDDGALQSNEEWHITTLADERAEIKSLS